MTDSNRHAHFDGSLTGVEIERLTVRDKDVAREAQRWTTGERGPIVDDFEVLATADLSAFVTEAVKIGSHALSAAGQAQDARALERMMKDLGEKAADTSTKAVEATATVVKDASEAVAKASLDAKKAITDADKATRKELQDSTKTVVNEVRRLFGGQHPEVVERMVPVLEKFGADLDAKAKSTFSALHDKAVKQFDPSDPTSPIAKHTATLDAQQQKLTKLIADNHSDLTRKVDEVVVALKVQEAKKAITTRSPEKGFVYEDAMGSLLHDIAAGLGDEYTDTRNTTGIVSRCKMGDGVLILEGGKTQVVVELTNSADRKWGPYFDEAERNREANASLGIVPTAEQNGGQSIRVLGSRRIVLAFDPQSDDPALLRTVVMLLRASALTVSSRRGAEEIATAEEKISEAIAQLDKIDKVKKLASSIQKNANKIETDCTGINAGIQRLLTDALTALSEVPDEEIHEAAAAS
ncbi:Fis family transcriptional regulator [Mycolicibacterium sp.]|uniref:Fis family transcriptional regulator n=1 Tax=Mycolicibacterium sp. TaxID=2320850 RepID=UPI00093BD518|nr:Fis family transcriptional regulator [Mycobacterium sp. DSM 3803]OKH81103.1 Fis family transcriptional regulator [Mycobacterium sp. SWH-M3]